MSTIAERRVASARRSSRVAAPAAVTGALGAAAVIAVWWLLAVTVFTNESTGRRTLPTPPEVIENYLATGLSFYVRNFTVTIAEAATGYAWGTGLALAATALVLVLPRLEAVVMQIATISYCLPIVAIGGIAVVIIGAPAAGAPSGAAVLLAALSVFFTTVVTSLRGLKAAEQASLDVVAVYGGSRLVQLRKVRVIAALPQVLSALQIAVPAALLGAVIGEFFGKVEYGVGPALIVAQQNLASDRLWGIALAIAAVALTGFALIGLVSRVAAPWSRGK
jgi:ABC-type nitrate/sulfonate/bicarbonate transport system permease component